MNYQAQVILKRVIDLVVSSILLLILLPLCPIMAAIICLDSPVLVFFLSTRVGHNGRHFTMYKLRTMRRDAEARLAEIQALNLGGEHMIKIPNDPRESLVLVPFCEKRASMSFRNFGTCSKEK